MRLFFAALLLFFVAGSILADKGSTSRRVVTGPVSAFVKDRVIAVAHDQFGTFRVSLSEGTRYENDRREPIDGAAITPGTRVSVSSFRNLGDRTTIVEKIQVHASTRQKRLGYFTR